MAEQGCYVVQSSGTGNFFITELAVDCEASEAQEINVLVICVISLERECVVSNVLLSHKFSNRRLISASPVSLYFKREHLSSLKALHTIWLILHEES